MNSQKTVVVGMSGGVDSSVAAALLKEQGYKVIGVFMRNWNDASVTINNECPWIDDSNDALLVAEALGIPFQVVDLSEQYKERIVDYMFAEYEKGRTPNPDILCNREVKFDLFMQIGLDLGADYIATGHYCQKTEELDPVSGEVRYNLVAGADPNKDQSYFLCQLSQAQLSKSLFPIGHLQKPEVRKIAAQYGLITAGKKDSQGLCFIGHVKLPTFLQQQLAPKEGLIVEISNDFAPFLQRNAQAAAVTGLAKAQILSQPIQLRPTDGKTVGKHQGAHYYTIGQRKGLQVGGKEKPLFVIATDTVQNVVYVGMGEEHIALNNHGLFIQQSDVHWLREDLRLKAGETAEYSCRIRYRQPLSKAELIATEDGLYILFEQAQKGIAAGQFAAWYDGDKLIGSGAIAG